MTAKDPKYTWLYCAACGRKMGKKPGVQVINGLLCDDPICQYQGPLPLNQQRDSYVVNAVLLGVPVTQVSFAHSMSRQRVYQILETWKSGV